jgi:hypothetical protein
MVPCLRQDLALSDVQRPLGQVPLIVGFDSDTGIPYALPIGEFNGRAVPAPELFPDGWYVLLIQQIRVTEPTQAPSNLRLR